MVTSCAWVCPPLLIPSHVPNLKPDSFVLRYLQSCVHPVLCLMSLETIYMLRLTNLNLYPDLSFDRPLLLPHTPCRSVQLNQLTARSYPPSPALSIRFRVTRFFSPTEDPSRRHCASPPFRCDITTVPHSSVKHLHPCPQHATACEQVSLLPSLPLGIVFTEHKDVSLAMTPDLRLAPGSDAGAPASRLLPPPRMLLLVTWAYSLESGDLSILRETPLSLSMLFENAKLQHRQFWSLIKPSFSPSSEGVFSFVFHLPSTRIHVA